MKKCTAIILALALTAALFGCGAQPEPTTVPTTIPETTVPETTVPETTVPETTVPETTDPYTVQYLEDCPPELLMEYWDEMVHAIEYTDGIGDSALVQKWLYPITCRIYGEPTLEDVEILEEFFAQLNALPNFPGIRWAGEQIDEGFETLSLSFLSMEDLETIFCDVIGGQSAWGAAQFWYDTDTNEIFGGHIGYWEDIPEDARKSILLEEICNVLGFNDTVLREDSVVYQYSNDNTELTDVDWLIMELLYHPAIRPGMTIEECHEILTELYQ